MSGGRTRRAAVEVWCLTVLAHTAAGGGMPSVPWLVGIAGLVALATGWVLRGSVRVSVMAPALVLAQVGLHQALAATGPVGHSAHAHAGTVTGMSARMMTAHVLCAALTAVVWWLRRGVVPFVLALTRARAIVVRRPAGRPAMHEEPVPAARTWLVGDPGRAPPRALATA